MSALEIEAAYRMGDIAGSLVAIERYDPCTQDDCDLRWERLLARLNDAHDKVDAVTWLTLNRLVRESMADRP